ncbi:SPOR domain-containing protein [Marinobacter halodurans]|uniref:SPOR domain-containing protein n=1 Tax=Marinobacter halodurans TaxID=2528979 RepID=A0ABY1ZGI7_9GAMM|nr:SPOR domain-containing protein [Marinobacter halodurans]TBW47510.1 SPOR domain-containing protein [Marinobacter halodurans]
MKWVVTLLVLLNILLGIAAIRWAPPGKQAPVGNEGRLPRVAELKIDVPSAPGKEQSASAARQPEGKVGEHQSSTPAGERLCGRLTGLESRAEAERLVSAAGVDARIESLTRQENARPPYHWVLIPPFPSREAALGRLEELQRAGVDSFLVTEGEYRNAISLGLFESKKLAEDLNARFQSRNIETVLVNADRNQISYALVFSVASKAGFDQFSRVVERSAGDLSSVENAACEGVASPDKNP